MGDAGMTRGAPEAPGYSPHRAHLSRGERRGRAECEDVAARQALDNLYQEHYVSLLRLAALLTGDTLRAERIAADSLLALMSAPGKSVAENALFRLRQQVVVRSRHLATLHRPSHRARPGRAECSRTSSTWESSPVMRVLAVLSTGKREAIVLRHYLDLTEQEAAAIMGASREMVRRNLASAMAAFGPIMLELQKASPTLVQAAEETET